MEIDDDSISSLMVDGELSPAMEWTRKKEFEMKAAATFEKSPEYLKSLKKRPPHISAQSLIGRIYGILSTNDIFVVSTFFGLNDVPYTRMTRDVVKQHVARCLQRGNAGGFATDRFSTSSTYWPKQADFLSWMSKRADLHTGFSRLQLLIRLSVGELKKFTWSRKGDSHMLVTETSALKYMEWKLEQYDIPAMDVVKIIDLDNLSPESSHANDIQLTSRRPRERRPHMSVPNFRLHKNALCELQNFQLDMLHLPLAKKLSESSLFSTFVSGTIS